MSCGTCGIQASDTMQEDTGVPAGAPTTATRPRCPRCKAFLAAPGAVCHNPRCPPVGHYVRQTFLGEQQRRDETQCRDRMFHLLGQLYQAEQATAGLSEQGAAMFFGQQAGRINSPADPTLQKVLAGLVLETHHLQDQDSVAARHRAEDVLADAGLPPALRLQRKMLRWGEWALDLLSDNLPPSADRRRYWTFGDAPAMKREWARAQRLGYLTPELAALVARRAARIQQALVALAENADASHQEREGARQSAAWVRQARIVGSSLSLPAALAGALEAAGLGGLPVGVVEDESGLHGLRIGAEGPDSMALLPVADPDEQPSAETRWQVSTPPLRKPSPPEDAVAAIKRTVLTLARQMIRAAWMTAEQEARGSLRRLVDIALDATGQTEEVKVEVGENGADLILDDTIHICQYPGGGTVGTSWQAVVDEGDNERRPLDDEAAAALFSLVEVDPCRPATVAETAVLWLLERRIHEALFAG